MGYIYVVTPVGNELRPIDLDKRCFDGRRPYPPEVNHNNVKLGKTERPIHHRHREYKKILHNLIFKTTEKSWHGLPEPIKCPDDKFRKT